MLTLGGHPRAGGADADDMRGSVSDSGSSPRWRGGRRSPREDDRTKGVIPALAGRTLIVDGQIGSPGGHPRAGGADF